MSLAVVMVIKSGLVRMPMDVVSTFRKSALSAWAYSSMMTVDAFKPSSLSGELLRHLMLLFLPSRHLMSSRVALNFVQPGSSPWSTREISSKQILAWS